MLTLNQKERHALAEKLKIFEERVLDKLKTTVLSEPSGISEYGEMGIGHCANDARYHLTFLRNAIEFGSQDTFGQYVRWTTHLLQSRNIPPQSTQNFFIQISHALDSHLSEWEQQVVREFLLDIPKQGKTPGRQTQTIKESPLKHHQEVFLQALLAPDRQAARNIAFEAFSQHGSLLDIYVDIFEESLYAIGHLWESNHISVAQEHVATAITQYVIAQMFTCVHPTQANQRKGIITGVEGEFHQIGAHMVSDLLEIQGWDIRFLGVNVPHKAILQMIEEFQPDLVGISATMILNLPAVKSLITEVRRQSPSGGSRRVLVGGSAFRAMPEAYQEIGADGFTQDLRSLMTVI